MVGLATITFSRSSVWLTATTFQSSYPLKSENASPSGTCSVYLSCAEMASPHRTASAMPSTAAEMARKRREDENGIADMISSCWMFQAQVSGGSRVGSARTEVNDIKRHRRALLHQGVATRGRARALRLIGARVSRLLQRSTSQFTLHGQSATCKLQATVTTLHVPE